jgi:hypothetical protein
VPNLFLRTWEDGAPGLWARVLAWAGFGVVLWCWMARAARGRGAQSPVRALAATAAIVLATALALERWPTARRAPVFGDAVEVRPGVTVFPRAGGEILVRARDPLAAIRIRATGNGTVRVPGLPPFVVGTGGTHADVPVSPVAHLAGRRGVEEWMYRQRIDTSDDVAVAILPNEAAASE